MQKFKKYDHVQIAKQLPRDMSSFTGDIDAVVMGSYADLCGGSKDGPHEYELYIRGEEEVAWYPEATLTLIDNQGKSLLKQWRKEAAENETTFSDLDWIFQNGPAVIEAPEWSSLQALADCLGYGRLWGDAFAAEAAYINGTIVLQSAIPFLRAKDKEGWLTFCKAAKEKTCSSMERS